MYLNTMPWGLGFAISVEKDFAFEALPEEAKRAVVCSMAAVINMGGLSEVTEDGTIRITETARPMTSLPRHRRTVPSQIDGSWDLTHRTRWAMGTRDSVVLTTS